MGHPVEGYIFIPKLRVLLYRVTIVVRDHVLLNLFSKFHNITAMSNLPALQLHKQKWADSGTTNLKSTKTSL